MCPIDLPTMRESDYLTVSLWGGILDDCVKISRHISLVHHIGRPPVWKHLATRIRMRNDSGLSIYGHISTKGILFTENKIEIISATGTDFLRICIDMLRPHVYKKIGNSHQQYVITNNIKMVLDEAPTLKVQLQLKRTKLNEDETARDYFAMFGKQQNGSVFYAPAMDLGRRTDCLCNKLDYEHCVIGWEGTVGLYCADYWIENRLENIADSTTSDIFDEPFANRMRQMIRANDLRIAPACKNQSMDHMRAPIRRLISSDEE